MLIASGQSGAEVERIQAVLAALEAHISACFAAALDPERRGATGSSSPSVQVFPVAVQTVAPGSQRLEQRTIRIEGGAHVRHGSVGLLAQHRNSIGAALIYAIATSSTLTPSVQNAGAIVTVRGGRFVLGGAAGNEPLVELDWSAQMVLDTALYVEST